MSLVLVIEDNADIRRLLHWALEPEGHDIVEASNGAAGLERLKSVRPAIVLVDAMMPGEIDGYEVCRRIKADPDFGRIPIVMVSAKAYASDRALAKAAGADEFLAKPFSPVALADLVARLLNATASQG